MFQWVAVLLQNICIAFNFYVHFTVEELFTLYTPWWIREAPLGTVVTFFILYWNIRLFLFLRAIQSADVQPGTEILRESQELSAEKIADLGHLGWREELVQLVFKAWDSGEALSVSCVTNNGRIKFQAFPRRGDSTPAQKTDIASSGTDPDSSSQENQASENLQGKGSNHSSTPQTPVFQSDINQSSPNQHQPEVFKHPQRVLLSAADAENIRKRLISTATKGPICGVKPCIELTSTNPAALKPKAGGPIKGPVSDAPINRSPINFVETQLQLAVAPDSEIPSSTQVLNTHGYTIDIVDKEGNPVEVETQLDENGNVRDPVDLSQKAGGRTDIIGLERELSPSPELGFYQSDI